MLIQLYRDNYTEIPEENLQCKIYDGYYDGDLNWFNTATLLDLVPTSDLTTLSTITGNLLDDADLTSKSLNVNGFFRARETGTYKFGLISGGGNDAYSGFGIYPQPFPFANLPGSQTTFNYDTHIILNLRIESNSKGLLVEFGGGNGFAICVGDYNGNKSLQFLMRRNNALITNEVVDISQYVNQSNTFYFFVNRVGDELTSVWDVVTTVNGTQIDNFSISSGSLSGTDPGTIGGCMNDHFFDNLTSSQLSDVIFDATNFLNLDTLKYTSPIYNHYVYYNLIPSLDLAEVKSDVYVNNTRVAFRDATNNYPFITEGSINLVAGMYYPINIYLGKSTTSGAFGVYVIEPTSNTKIFNHTGLTTYYDINPENLTTETTSSFPLTYLDGSLQGNFRVSPLALYINRPKFSGGKGTLFYLASDELFNNFNGTYKNYIQLHEKPVADDDERKRFTQFSSDMSFECELDGKIEIVFRRGVNEPISWTYAMVILDVERIPTKTL